LNGRNIQILLEDGPKDGQKIFQNIHS